MTLFLANEARIYNGAKKASLVSDSENTGQLHVKECMAKPIQYCKFFKKASKKKKKNEIRTLPNAIHKDKLRMD